MLSPTFLVLVLVVGYPLVAAVRLSFTTQGTGIDPKTGFVIKGDTFVGLQNYLDLFSGDTGAQFGQALFNTTSFTVVGVALETVIGVAMALVMSKALRGQAFIRAAILIPWVIPTAVSGLLWQWIFNSDGIANKLIGQQILWAADGWPAWWSVTIADVWKTAPFIGLLVLAGLQIIDKEAYEAAAMDGAGPWRTFFSITLPLVRPALVTAVLFRILDVLRLFDLPYVLTGLNKEHTVTLSMIAYDEAVNNNHFGPAAAYSTVLFLYIAIVAFAFVRLFGANVFSSADSRVAR
jgi:multiple sugar transport system permease protein